MANNFLATANRVAAHLGKAPKDFTKEDIIRVVQDFDIRMVNLMYPGGDGRLKTLNFMLNSADYLNTCGERVDGSSLFSSIEAASSDLYVMPVFRTAFIDPFQEIPTLCLLCDYFDRDGQPLASAPEHTLRKAMQAFHKVTGMEFQAMGELEYYVIKANDPSFPATDQKGYHETAPFAKANDFRTRCMKLIAECGGRIKYGHSEVGNFTASAMSRTRSSFSPCQQMSAPTSCSWPSGSSATSAIRRATTSHSRRRSSSARPAAACTST